jgi:hypothetical protein
MEGQSAHQLNRPFHSDQARPRAHDCVQQIGILSCRLRGLVKPDIVADCATLAWWVQD